MKQTVGYFLTSKVIKDLYVCLFVFWKGGEGKHLSGDLCRSGLKNFILEKVLPQTLPIES